ncbi:MAG: FAD-dependent oxidoreductase [Bacteroidota bacterium]
MTNYDVVIVGAGLAGLAAASKLSNHRVLLIEQASTIGGRVHTQMQFGVRYDLGGVLAPNPSYLPEDLQKIKRKTLSKKMGVLVDGKVVWGVSVVDCLNNANLSGEEKKGIRTFFQQLDVNFSQLSSKAGAIIDAFFQFIHPTSIEKYVGERKKDALLKMNFDFWEAGNQQLSNYLNSHSSVEIWTNTKVVKIADQGATVAVTYSKDGKSQQVSAKKVIITTPAPIADKILSTQNSATQQFFGALNYAAGACLVVAIDTKKLVEFSLVVGVDTLFSSVLQQRKREILLRLLFTLPMRNCPISVQNRQGI